MMYYKNKSVVGSSFNPPSTVPTGGLVKDVLGGILPKLSEIIAGGFDFSCFNSTWTPSRGKAAMTSDVFNIVSSSNIEVNPTTKNLQTFLKDVAWYVYVCDKWSSVMRSCSKKTLQKMAETMRKVENTFLAQLKANIEPTEVYNGLHKPIWKPYGDEGFTKQQPIVVQLYKFKTDSNLSSTPTNTNDSTSGNTFTPTGNMLGLASLGLIGFVLTNDKKNKFKLK